MIKYRVHHLIHHNVSFKNIFTFLNAQSACILRKIAKKKQKKKQQYKKKIANKGLKVGDIATYISATQSITGKVVTIEGGSVVLNYPLKDFSNIDSFPEDKCFPAKNDLLPQNSQNKCNILIPNICVFYYLCACVLCATKSKKKVCVCVLG